MLAAVIRPPDPQFRRSDNISLPMAVVAIPSEKKWPVLFVATQQQQTTNHSHLSFTHYNYIAQVQSVYTQNVGWSVSSTFTYD